MLRSGVVGLKCFLGPSGVPEFPPITKDQLENAIKKIEDSDTILAIHAEMSPLKPIIPDESKFFVINNLSFIYNIIKFKI